MTLRVGDPAVDVNLLSNENKKVSLKDYRQKKYIILYFYPKDDTPGCTVEACGFRDAIKGIENINAVVLGISPDDVDSHQKFIKKFNLPFLLLSDPDQKTCRDYGVWIEKNMYGRKYMGVARTTFVMDKDGKILKIFEKVKPQGHEEEVLEFLKSLM